MITTTTLTLNPGTAVQRLGRTYKNASPKAIAHGAPWYTDVHDWCAELAKATGHSTRAVCGAFAALSPRNKLARNKAMAVAMAHGRATSGLSLPIAKAGRVLAGEDWGDVLNGPKERAFADNCSAPLTSQAATMDTWAFRLLFPAGTPLADIERWAKRKGSYASAERCYRMAAARAGVPTHVFQAITWCAVRGSHA